MEKNHFPGIFYNIRYNKADNATTNGIISIIKDSGSYSIDGIPFKINGKLDKSGYYMNMANILEMISGKIQTKETKKAGEMLKSSDNEIYESGYSNKQQP